MELFYKSLIINNKNIMAGAVKGYIKLQIN
jgi:hypothetical protein